MTGRYEPARWSLGTWVANAKKGGEWWGRVRAKRNTKSKISDIPVGVLRVVQQSRYG